MLSENIKREIRSLWDKMWSGGIANPITAIEQISYLLFMRRLDDTDQQRLAQASFTGQPYTSIFKGRYWLPGTEPTHANGKKRKPTKEETENFSIDKKELRWSQFSKMTDPANQLEHIRKWVFPFIKDLGKADDPFARHMQTAYFAIAKPSLLTEAITIINRIYTIIEIDIKDGKQTFQDTLGDLYEYLLNEIASAGKNGQFRTPRHIIQMICELVQPRLGEKICDPTCGTAGFLLGAYQYIQTQHTPEQFIKEDDNGFRRGSLPTITDKRLQRILQQETFYGFDFDTTMVRLGLMNLMLHGIDRPNIKYQDTLSKNYTEADEYNLILANPPFKGSIDKNDVHDSLALDTGKTELLFLSRIINMLAIGGRAAVIVPDGVLFGSSKAHQALRKMLLYRCDLHAVISMPGGVFKPYAGVSTAILYFSKAANHNERRHTRQVWFYNMQADGFSLDDKREVLKHPDGGRNTGDLHETYRRYQAREAEAQDDRTQKHFYVPADEIEKEGYDLSLNRYKQSIYRAAQYRPAAELLQLLEEYETKIKAGLDELKEMMK
jgi:type I restriction enzyme M protein